MLQVAIAVFIATALGYGIVLPDSAVRSAYARQFSQACKWSAITSLTISAPVIFPQVPLMIVLCDWDQRL